MVKSEHIQFLEGGQETAPRAPDRIGGNGITEPPFFCDRERGATPKCFFSGALHVHRDLQKLEGKEHWQKDVRDEQRPMEPGQIWITDGICPHHLLPGVNEHWLVDGPWFYPNKTDNSKRDDALRPR